MIVACIGLIVCVLIVCVFAWFWANGVQHGTRNERDLAAASAFLTALLILALYGIYKFSGRIFNGLPNPPPTTSVLAADES